MLNEDIKKANYEENIISKKPNDSENKINSLNKTIQLNKGKLRESDDMAEINKN